MKILILTTTNVPEYIKGSTFHTVSQGIIDNNINLYSNSPLCNKTNKISVDEIYEVGKKVDYIILFITDASGSLKDYNSANNCVIVEKFLEINRPEISLYIDYFEYSWTNKPLNNTNDYYRSEPFTYTFLKNYCRFYFKRECYPDLFKKGYLPIQIFSPNKEHIVDEVFEKDIDIFCSFPQKYTGLRMHAIDVCKFLELEGFKVVIKDDIQSIEEYYKYIKRSFITLDGKGGGFQNIRFLEIIKYKSLCFREKYEIFYPNDFNIDMIVEYQSPDELYSKLKFYLSQKDLVLKMIENAHTHFLDYHTPQKIVQNVLSYFNTEICIFGNSKLFKYTKYYFKNKLNKMNNPNLHLFTFDDTFNFEYDGNIKLYNMSDVTSIDDYEYYQNRIKGVSDVIIPYSNYLSFDQVADIRIISSTHCDKGIIRDLDMNTLVNLYTSLFPHKIMFSHNFDFEKINSNENSFIFFIPSIINIKQERHIGVFTSEERLNQTLEQVKSIKKLVPNSIIILLEMSYLNLYEISTLYPYVDFICLYYKDTECNAYSNDINKNKGELYVLKHISKLLYDSNILFSHFTKFGGRYSMTNSFSIKNICRDIPTFKLINGHNSEYKCCGINTLVNPVLYSIPYKYIKEYICVMDESWNILVINNIFTDVEHLLYFLFVNMNIPFKSIEKFDIYGCMGITGNFYTL